MNMTLMISITLGSGFLALAFAGYKAAWIYRQKVIDAKLIEISGYVAEGAMAFLRREYRVLTIFVLVVAALLAVTQKGMLRWEAAAFALGAVCSATAGWFGMKVATAANARTTSAARAGLNEALLVAFSGGTVMGMCVVGLALVGIGLVLGACHLAVDHLPDTLLHIWLPVLSGFSLGASSIALFARLGGGIYTKAADVGADLVGKVEASIPEDDPRNPATIADNVGDNVGDVAGMGADLFESYVGSIVGSLILALESNASTDIQLRLMAIPLLAAGLGVVCSIVGALLVRARPGESPQKALNTGTLSAAFLATVLLYPLVTNVLAGGSYTTETGVVVGALQVWLAAVVGLGAGVAIGFLTEYYTGSDRKPVLSIVKSCETGSATTIITGVGVGMISTVLPTLVLAVGILVTYAIAGLYGVAMAALGMLITLGVQLAVDAYGPIADNAGGLAQMSEFPPSVRKITDSLDAVGNTTAAIGKGFAIGSAALTSIILFTAFRHAAGVKTVDLTSPEVLAGIFLGAMIPYLFSAMAMAAIGRSAFAMIEEVRRQFRSIPGLLDGTGKADYARCVDISTAAALKEMVLPGIIAIASPVAVGFFGGPYMLTGLLTGATVSGVLLAIFMANSGGAWDNAKKMIEEGHAGGKGSDAHKAAVVGDTVGDPFKDTAGPALNILIKLMAVVSLIIAPLMRVAG